MRSRITTTLTRAPLPIKLALGVLLLALAAFGYWTIAPLFVTTRVDEAFPAVAVQATSLPAVPTSLPPTVAAPTALPVAAAATLEPAATSVPTVAVAPTIVPTTVPTVAVAPTIAPTTVPTVAVAPTIAPASAEPIVLARGRFTQIDRLHGADGMAVIYQLPDGQRVLRFEGFDAKNGPDLRVSLAGHAQPRRSPRPGLHRACIAHGDSGQSELCITRRSRSWRV